MFMTALIGKAALITGASRGIGRATAVRMAEEGAAVYLAADGTLEELEKAAAECRERNPTGAVTMVGIFDLTQLGAAETMVRQAHAALDRIDILVNNAGVRLRKPIGEFTQADYDFVMNVNLRSPFFACQAVLPIMRQQGGGRIINVASQMGSVTRKSIALYAMSKAALIHMTRSLAMECAAEGITANTVSPGPIETEYNSNRLRDDPQTRKQMTDDVPIGRFGTPEEVAEVIAFLATSKGNYIHGHDLLVDGGHTIH
jgi:NAD(P)-dependent dehydrogenase (short-subunit alcohol dehydrogenase family)